MLKLKSWWSSGIPPECADGCGTAGGRLGEATPGYSVESDFDIGKVWRLLSSRRPTEERSSDGS